jgi:cell wall-associated NlpC family hydrolase
MDWAADYFELPFVDQGRDRRGVDCWGLVRLVYQEQLDIDLPDFLFSAYDRSLRPEIAAAYDTEHRRWRPVETPALFDVAVFRVHHTPFHYAVMLDANHMLHIEVGCNVAKERIDSPRWNRRLVGVYRHQRLSSPL